jgi:succinate dehydrogenase/fumarate reductase cytochrome b subunit
VLREFFSTENFLWQQVEAEIKERWITRLQSRSRERNVWRRLLSDSSLLWWKAVLLAWFLPLVCHGFAGFFLEEEDERE